MSPKMYFFLAARDASCVSILRKFIPSLTNLKFLSI